MYFAVQEREHLFSSGSPLPSSFSIYCLPSNRKWNSQKTRIAQYFGLDLIFFEIAAFSSWSHHSPLAYLTPDAIAQ